MVDELCELVPEVEVLEGECGSRRARWHARNRVLVAGGTLLEECVRWADNAGRFESRRHCQCTRMCAGVRHKRESCRRGRWLWGRRGGGRVLAALGSPDVGATVEQVAVRRGHTRLDTLAHYSGRSRRTRQLLHLQAEERDRSQQVQHRFQICQLRGVIRRKCGLHICKDNEIN